MNDLHSNMVRFIINIPDVFGEEIAVIYIPIWLDLLFASLSLLIFFCENLHSNMVRFIIRAIFNRILY